MNLTQDTIYDMAPYAKTLGLTFPTITPDEVVSELALAPKLSTMGGGLHGGAVMSACDLAAAILVGINVPTGASWTTAESTTYFLRPVVNGGARAHATPLRLGRTLTSVSVDVVDFDGRLCARTTQLVAVQAQ